MYMYTCSTTFMFSCSNFDHHAWFISSSQQFDLQSSAQITSPEYSPIYNMHIIYTNHIWLVLIQEIPGENERETVSNRLQNIKLNDVNYMLWPHVVKTADLTEKQITPSYC